MEILVKTFFLKKTFKYGGMIFVWDLLPSESSDNIQSGISGNLRLNIQTPPPNTENYKVYVVGVTNGSITVDSNKRVKTSYLM